MNKFNELLADLNFFDSSVGISPITTTTETIETLNEYNITPIEVTNNYVLFSDDGQQYKLFLNVDWQLKKCNNTSQLTIGSKIEITGFYDEIAWYSKLLGKQFEVIEINDSDVKIKRGNGKISYYVGLDDFRIIA